MFSSFSSSVGDQKILHFIHVTPLKEGCELWKSFAPINCSSAAISNVIALPPPKYFKLGSLYPTVQSSSSSEKNFIWAIYSPSLKMVVTILVIFFDGSNVWLVLTSSNVPDLTDSPEVIVISNIKQ